MSGELSVRVLLGGGVLPLFALILSPLFAFAGSYTNHASVVLSGVPVALSGKTATLSNAMETVTVPLSTFPERERRRLAADYAGLHPEVGTQALLIPRDIRLAVEGYVSSVRRSQYRAAKGLCTREESAEYCAKAHTALTRYLDRQVSEGRLLPAERKTLVRREE